MPERHLAQRVLNRFQTLCKVLPPRARASYFKMLWNGWTTAARFQQRMPCVLCRGETTEDRIEHYVHCRPFKKLLVYRMGLPERFCSLAHVFMLIDGLSEYEVTLIGIAVYSLFRASRHCKNDSLSATQLDDILRQFCFTCVRGHANAQKALTYAFHTRFAKERPGARHA